MDPLPEIVTTVDALRSRLEAARTGDGRASSAASKARAEIGFVPTMGALHEGHLALVARAKEEARFVVVSIFVNPTQFGPNEDFARYPRDVEGDARKLAGRCDLVFAPPASVMYPEGEATRVRVEGLPDALCGPFRPGHFEGVTTIVAKLFALMGPHVAVFGRKDYQQLAIVRQMAKDLLFPVRIVGLPTVREADGLAKSSRNALLAPDERARAAGIARGLRAAVSAFDAGERRPRELEAAALREVGRAVDRVDYVSVVDPERLAPFGGDAGPRALLAVAAHVGRTRLIDNVVLGEERV